MKKLIIVLLSLVSIQVAWLGTHRDTAIKNEPGPAPAPSPLRERAVAPVGTWPTASGNGTATPASPPSAPDPNDLNQGSDLIEVEDFWQGGLPAKVSRKEYERRCQVDLQYLEGVIKQDVAAGFNEEVRRREAQMRKLCGSFSVGLPSSQVLELLGQPEAVKLKKVVPGREALGDLAWGNPAAVTQGMIYRYTPTNGLPFNVRNGFGYQVLFVCFDAKGQLSKWQWDKPGLLFSGQLGMWQKPEEAFAASPQK